MVAFHGCLCLNAHQLKLCSSSFTSARAEACSEFCSRNHDGDQSQNKLEMVRVARHDELQMSPGARYLACQRQGIHRFL